MFQIVSNCTDTAQSLLLSYSYQSRAPSAGHSTPNVTPDFANGPATPQQRPLWRFSPKTAINVDQSVSALYQSSQQDPNSGRDAVSGALSHTVRDQILSMVAAASPGSMLVSIFPSAYLLDTLIQYYVYSLPSSDEILHIPTFNPNRARPGLSAAIICAGATLTPDGVFVKFGLNLMEYSPSDHHFCDGEE